jgi:flagellar protein FlaI
MTTVEEIIDYEKYRNTYSWKSSTDSFVSSIGKSPMLAYIGKRAGKTEEELIAELERRKNVLSWMRSRNIRSYRDVAAIIAEYYARPDEFYSKRVEEFVASPK